MKDWQWIVLMVLSICGFEMLIMIMKLLEQILKIIQKGGI